jgi:hypothetical protein
MLPIRVPHAPTPFVCLAGVVSLVSFTLAVLYGWSWSASLWAAVAGAALCGLIAALAPALEAGAALLARKGGWATICAIFIFWPAAITMELLVISVDLGAIAARSDETEALRQKAVKLDGDRDANIASLRRTLNEDSAELLAARKMAAAAEETRKAECGVRGPRCREAEAADREAAGWVLREARTQFEERKNAADQIEKLHASATQGPLVAAANPLQHVLEPLIGAWAGTFTQQLQLALASALGFGRLLLISIAGLMADPLASVKAPPLRLANRLLSNRMSRRASVPTLTLANPVMIVRSVLVPSPGARTPIEAAYASHKARCATMGLIPLSATEFAEGAREFCRLACVRAEEQFLIDVDLEADHD